MREFDLPVQTLQEAAVVLDRHRPPLNPSLPSDLSLYVERHLNSNEKMVLDAAKAAHNNRPWRWFLTGHTGTGKSTELNRIINDPRVTDHYVTEVIGVKNVLDINNLDWRDILLAMAMAVTEAASKHGTPIPDELRERIRLFKADVVSETESGTQTDGTAGLVVDLPFLKLGEEVKSGGHRRKIIREKIYEEITQFIGMINGVAEAIEAARSKRLLVVIDTLDHVDHGPLLKIFTEYWSSLSSPRISLLFILPLSMLHEQRFMEKADNKVSLVPSIPVNDTPKGEKLSEPGYQFFRDVISRLTSLSCFDEEALQDIFRLSAGVVRDMIGFAGEACSNAHAENPDGRVERRHVDALFQERKRYFRGILLKADYEVLRSVDANEYPMGIDGMAPLLHLKAILFYPNGEGYYALNPAVKALLGATHA